MTKHDRRDTHPVTVTQTNHEHVDVVVEKLKALRRNTTLGDPLWRELRDQGRP